MKKVTVSFDITAGPLYIADLGLCLTEPYPLGFSRTLLRHPGFKIDLGGNVWEKYPKRMHDLLHDATVFVERPPVHIMSLTNDELRRRWLFRGIIELPSARLGDGPRKIPVRGWFNIDEQKGKIWFSKGR